MKRHLFFALLLGICLCTTNGLAAEHRIGAGVNYWKAMDDIDIPGEDIEEDGLSYILSYQFWPGILGYEIDMEFLPDRFGDSAISPQAYVLIGSGLYAGAGIGVVHSGSDFSEPFLALKAGFNLTILPGVYGDIYANYRFNDTQDLDDSDTDIDTDTVFLGCAIRVDL